jgi:hypothetical protein
MQNRETIHFLAHAKLVVKLACYGDGRFKIRSVTEILVEEKKLVRNIHKQLKMYMVPAFLIRSLLVAGIRELHVLKRTKGELVTRVFGILKNVIHGKRYGSDDNVTEDVKRWLQIRCSWFCLASRC